MWTQMAKADKGQGVESNQLFFDSESRQVQSDLDSEGNAEQAKALAMQSQLVQVINRLQQRKQDDSGFDHVRNSFGGKGVASGKHTHIPPEIPPAIFSLPKGQEVAPSAGQLPTARGDLEQLQRLSVELFGAAFGVPSDLLFSGRHIPPAAPTPPRAFHSHRKPAYAAQVCQQVNGPAQPPQQHGHVAGQVDQRSVDGRLPRPVP